jgi:hypothetical protein
MTHESPAIGILTGSYPARCTCPGSGPTLSPLPLLWTSWSATGTISGSASTRHGANRYHYWLSIWRLRLRIRAGSRAWGTRPGDSLTHLARPGAEYGCMGTRCIRYPYIMDMDHRGDTCSGLTRPLPRSCACRTGYTILC